MVREGVQCLAAFPRSCTLRQLDIKIEYSPSGHTASALLSNVIAMYNQTGRLSHLERIGIRGSEQHLLVSGASCERFNPERLTIIDLFAS